MSDEEEGEVPVCGSFEPQVWRKGYCRNCFHPGSKHQSGNLIIDDDKRKFGKENIPRKGDKSGKDQQAADKGKPLKPTGQESGKSAADKHFDNKHDKLLEKDKPSFRDRYEKLQKDKSKQEEQLSARKTGSQKLGDDKKSIPDKKDSSKNIPPPVLPKTSKGLGSGDKLKSKSTSDIREEIKSPVGNKPFRVAAQHDSLDRSKSKFGSAENITSAEKSLGVFSKQKSGSAENLSIDKSGKSQKDDKSKDKPNSPSSDKSKLDYRNLLSGKSSKTEDKPKGKSDIEEHDRKVKFGKETKTANKGDVGLSKLDVKDNDSNKKGFPLKLQTDLKSPISSDKSPLFEKDKPDFKAKFEKPELKASKTEDKEKKDFKTKYEKPDLKSLQEKEKTDSKSNFEKSELKSADENEKKDTKSKYEKSDFQSVKEKEKKDDKSKHEKPELSTIDEKEMKNDKLKHAKPEFKKEEEKEQKDHKTKYGKPELKTVEAKEQKDDKIKYDKPELKKVEEKEQKDFKTKHEKLELKKVEQQDKKDYHLKFEKPEMKKVEEQEKKDYRSKFEKPEMKKVEEKETKDYKTKFEKPEMKKVEEKEKKDYKTKFEKPEMKKVEEKEKKDFKAKFEKPELKSSKAEDKKKDDTDDLKGKLGVGDKVIGKKSLNEMKPGVKVDDSDKSGSSKQKWKPKSVADEKDKSRNEGQKTELKSRTDLKSTKSEDKSKVMSTESDKKKHDKDISPASKWLSTIEKDKTKDNKKDDLTSKYEKPQLKSVKDDDKTKGKAEQSKSGKSDLKSGKDEKIDYKALLDNKKAKLVSEPEKQTADTKVKLQNLKSSKTDETPKKDFKAKFEKPQLKSAKSDEVKKDQKSLSEKSKLDSPVSSKTGETVKSFKPIDSLKEKDSKLEEREIIDNKLNQLAEFESNKDKAALNHEHGNKTLVNGSLGHEETDSLKQVPQVKENSTSADTRVVKSASAANYSQHIDNLSTNTKGDFDEPDNACALISARSESPVHVDTQVFTSSRNKTAGVDSKANDQLITTSQKGLSGSSFSENSTETPSKEKVEEKGLSKYDVISEIVAQKPVEEEEGSKPGIENDVEKLKRELMKMAEKCQQLEEENVSLKHGLSAKESDHSELEKQKREVETLILGLQDQLQTMEDRCNRLESDNSSLMSNLKKQEEASKNQPATEETEKIQDNIQYSESMVEDLIEENEELKQEIQDLKVEMEEMYDSFRDQEAEEFRELQKELEITAKNCRILQFKMRKAERRNEQLEDDRNQYVDKLRILQNQFENKDAVAHIKTLEQELKMAKDVSVRLHDELDLMDDKRTKVEEENRHLTELLEQADRKQFRLEIEVDKLRDQIIDLRHQLNAAKSSDDPDNPPKKINCAEFLAIHRDII